MTKAKDPKISEHEGLVVFQCWHCADEGGKCEHCRNSRRLIYVNGYAFPFTAEGKRLAKAERSKVDNIATDLKRLDEHIIQPKEYEDAPELTDEQIAKAEVHEDKRVDKRIRPRRRIAP